MSDQDYSLSDHVHDEDEAEDASIPDSDYDITSRPRPSRSSKHKQPPYTITNALKAPRATTYTAQALFDQIVNGDIDLDPEYQRDVVWPEAKQVGLIDSVFRNFYIPPVIFSVKSAEDGSETRTCIDGKQRLTSIYRFMLGLIHHRDRQTGDKYWYKDNPATQKKRRNLLPEKYRRLFANKQVVCVEYGEIGDKDEREIFQRVQLGMALTPAEKLCVVKSPRADFVRQLQSTFFKDDSSALLSLAWDRARGTDFRCLATILWCIDRYHSSPTSMVNTGSIVQLESFLNSPKQYLSPALQKIVKQGFQTFEEMVASNDDAISGPFRMNKTDFPNSTSMKVEKVSPVEFICICLLILVWREKMSQLAMATAIRDMRRAVRSEYIDVRMNTRVAKSMITFLKAIKPEEYEAAAGKTKSNSAAISPKKLLSPRLTEDAKVGKKRKRVEEEDAVSISDVSMLDGTPTMQLSSKSSKTRVEDLSSKSSSSSRPATATARKSTGGLAAMRRVVAENQSQVPSQPDGAES